MRRIARLSPRVHALKPCISYTQAQRSWFLHEGNIYAFESASASLFRAFIKTHQPHQWRVDHACLIVLKASKLDLEAKWFVLCSFLDEQISLPLYASYQEAYNALHTTTLPIRRSLRS
jgi:alpha-galactosidase